MPHDAFGAGGMAGGMGGGGGFGMTPGQAGNARSRVDGEQLAPPMAEGLGRNIMDGGEQSLQEFTYDGLAPGPTPGNTGLASLDFQLPVRGNEYFFTTPRGDTRITVQAIEQQQIQRFEQLGLILVCFAAIGGLIWLVVRVYSLLSRRVRATLLILLGVGSLISGKLMVIGLLALIWGFGMLAATWFLPNESTQPA